MVELIEKLPVKDISELPLRAQGLRHDNHLIHPYGIIYKGVRYVEGHAKILATKHHVENKLAWFKGLVDHVRMTSRRHAHYNIHESSTILDETVETLQTKLEEIVEKAPNAEAKRKLHEDGWKMIHGLMGELRPEVADHKLTHLANGLSALVKLDGIIDKTESAPHKEELIQHLKVKACELHNQGVSLADIQENAPNAFGGMDEGELDNLMKENPDAAVKAIKAGKHHLQHPYDVASHCAKVAPRNAALTPVSQ
ncbi:MAG: hypothetical protein K2X98_02805 [Alphaproteobacteria bacterium]|nr:hypothetical protein [Alphaproteobacteria bacterium]